MDFSEVLTWAVPTLVILLVLVLVHELGHFVTAKLAGVSVEEFGFGYPPRLVSFHFRGTVYSLNLLPLGGFVKLLGEEGPSGPRGFASRQAQTRLIILAAGPLMNALLPIPLLTASLMVPHQAFDGPVRIAEVAPGSPAEAAGLRPGDIVLRVNDRPIHVPRDLRYNVQLNLGSETEMTVRRDGETKIVRVSPRWDPPPAEGPIGMKAFIRPEELREATVSSPLPAALWEGVRRTSDMLTILKNDLYSGIIGRAGPGVTGPIGIAQATGEVARGGVLPLLEWTAFLSMNLAILNILPIPMLDGGRIAFVLLEWVRRGRRVVPKREGLVHLIGFALLMAFVLVVSVADIQRITGGGTLIP